MALRNPVYLDIDSLLAQAEYHDITVPRQQSIVERTTKTRSGAAKANIGAISGGGEGGTEVEFQSTYTITPTQKAIVSRVIDALVLENAITPISDDVAISRDTLVELDGELRLTSASLAGKLFHILLQYLRSTEQDFRTLNFSDIDPGLVKLVQSVYVGNELVPIPQLLEIQGDRGGLKMYVNLAPNSFIGTATVDHVEGQRRVLGTVRHIIGENDENGLSAEEWLLSGWEYLIKRLLMTNIEDQVKTMFDSLDLKRPGNDVKAAITGPSLIVDAIAVY